MNKSLHLFFLIFFFWCGPFSRSLLNLLQYCFCFMFLFFWPKGMWDPSSLTRDQTHTPALEAWNLNHWTTREVSSNSWVTWVTTQLCNDSLSCFFMSVIAATLPKTCFFCHIDLLLKVVAQPGITLIFFRKCVCVHIYTHPASRWNWDCLTSYQQ